MTFLNFLRDLLSLTAVSAVCIAGSVWLSFFLEAAQ